MVALYNYIAIALLLAGTVIRLSGNSVKSKTNYLRFFAVVLIFFSAVRYEYGSSDYQAYLNSFYRIAARSLSEMLNNREIGYQLIQKLLSLFTDNAQVFMMFSSLLIVTSYCIFFKRYSQDSVISMMLFYFLGIYFSANNGTRQYMAVAICLFAYRYAIEKRFWPFLSLVLLASTIHTSAMVALIVYPLCGKRMTPIVLLMYILAMPVVYFAFPFILRFSQIFAYDYYGESSYGMVGSNILNLMLPFVSVALLAIIVLGRSKSDHRLHLKSYGQSNMNNNIISSRTENMCFHMIMLDGVLSIVQVFHVLNFGRISWYFNVGICIFFPLIINKLVKPQRKVATILITLAAFAYFLTYNYYGKFIPTPYNFFWNHN